MVGLDDDIEMINGDKASWWEAAARGPFGSQLRAAMGVA